MNTGTSTRFSRRDISPVSSRNGSVNMAKSTCKASSHNLPGDLALESESRGFKVIMDWGLPTWLSAGAFRKTCVTCLGLKSVPKRERRVTVVEWWR